MNSSGRLPTASEAISVCSSSDLPEPVVPATRPCGPSARMSIGKMPSVDSPMTALVVRPLPCQPRQHLRGVGLVQAAARRAAGSPPGSARGEVLGRDVADRCQRAGQPVEPEVADEVGPDGVDVSLLGGLEVELVALARRDRAALLGQLAHGAVEADEVDAAAADPP